MAPVFYLLIFFVNFVVQFVGIKIVNEKSTKVINLTADKGSKLTIQLMDSWNEP